MATMRSAARVSPSLAAAVTIMDEHGKVVKTSKTIFSAWGSAKEAYRQRKAEIQAERAAERRAREALRSKVRRHHTGHRSSRAIEDGSSDHGEASSSALTKSKSKHRRSHKGSDKDSGHGFVEEVEEEEAERELMSTNMTANEIMTTQLLGIAPALLHDPTIAAVQELLAHLQSILDEFACIRIGISTFIAELKKCPDTLAMVGLALGELANLMAKIAPNAMPVIQAAFPTVFALLGSPQVAVMAGIAGAATVVVLGGFKIVQGYLGAGEGDAVAKKEDDDDDGMAYGEDVHERPAPKPVQMQMQQAQKPLPSLPPSKPRLAIKGPPQVLALEVNEDNKSVASEDSDKKKRSKEKKEKEKKDRSKDKKERDEKEKEKKEKRDKEKEKEKEKHKEKEREREREKEKEKEKEKKEKRTNSIKIIGTNSLRISSSSEPSSPAGTTKSLKPSRTNTLKTMFQGRSA